MQSGQFLNEEIQPSKIDSLHQGSSRCAPSDQTRGRKGCVESVKESCRGKPRKANQIRGWE